MQVLPKLVLSLGFGMFPLLSDVLFGGLVVSFLKSCVFINDFMILFSLLDCQGCKGMRTRVCK